ncbi:MAG: hypothetical protein HC880_15795 [Bacteroidia bacterium]|nr:hypothetical protein [Bacteroidia bacterium]
MNNQTLIDKLKRKLEQNNLKGVARNLMDFGKQYANKDEDAKALEEKARGQLDRLHALEAELDDGLISTSDAKVEKRKISSALSKLIDRLGDLPEAEPDHPLIKENSEEATFQAIENPQPFNNTNPKPTHSMSTREKICEQKLKKPMNSSTNGKKNNS